MNLIESIILGIVQGLTEFFPISSSGHIELGKAFFAVTMDDNLLFSIVVHAATTLSIIVVFRKDIFSLLKEGILKFKFNKTTHYILKLLLSCVPVGIIGILFENSIEQLFDANLLLTSSMLLITGAVLIITLLKRNANNSKEISYSSTMLIGLAQAIAILPGISRSGVTIATALLLGVQRKEAARFSFLMSLTPIIGATLLKMKSLFSSSANTSLSNDFAMETSVGIILLAGFIASFLFGIFACRYMIKIVQKGNIKYFAYYCFIIGTSVLIYSILK